MKKWFENVSIEKKIKTSLLIATLISVLVGLVGIGALIITKNNQLKSYNENTLGIEYVATAESSFQDLRVALRDLYIYYDTDKETYIEKITSQKQDIQTQIDTYGKTVIDAEDQANYDALKTAYNKISSDVDGMVNTAKSGKSSDDYLTSLKNGKSDADATESAFKTVVDYNDTAAASQIQINNNVVIVSMIILIILIVISFIFSMILGKFVSGIISKPMRMISIVCEHLAVGDVDTESLIAQGVLTEEDKRVKDRKDEIGTAALGLNQLISGTAKLSREAEIIASGDLTTEVTVRSEKDVMGKALKKLVEDFHVLGENIISASDQVESGAKQVADSSMSLSQGATEQASSIQELSASIIDVSQRIKENADAAAKAKEVTELTANILNNSASQMNLARDAMDEISATSKNISKVIKAIDDIAFQTNILALNAAVEAARAGAAGKGFAVVADEVRNLSQKSAEAAKNTTSLIESSITAVEKGSDLITKTSLGFSEVVIQAAEVVKLVDDIALQAQGQAASVQQISVGVEQISTVVQMNSATSEESAAASEELLGMANGLKTSVGQLKI